MTTLLVIGGGKMGEALVAGLLAGGWAKPADLAILEKVPGRRDELADRFPGITISGEPVPAGGAVVAVKPGDVEDGCRATASAGAGRVLSVAAGVRLADLERSTAAGTPGGRVMPNTV